MQNPAKGGAYMQEVVDELVKGLTQEDLKGKLVVILAGYEVRPLWFRCFRIHLAAEVSNHLLPTWWTHCAHPVPFVVASVQAEIDDMLLVNQGLKSRFNERFLFEELTPAAAARMLDAKLAADGLVLSAEARAAAEGLIAGLAALPGFGNGRDVDSLAKRAFAEVAKRESGSPGGGGGGAGDAEEVVGVEELRAAVAHLSAQRKAAPGGGGGGSGGAGKPAAAETAQQALEMAFAVPPPPQQQTTTTKTVAQQQEAAHPQQPAAEAAEPQTAAVAPPVDPWQGMPAPFLSGLQAALDSLGLNSLAAVRKLASMPDGSEELLRLASEIATRAGVSDAEAAELLREWRRRYGSVEEGLRAQEEEQAQAKAQGRMAMVPIWRCAVCGRADKPWIACYVSPFIVRYEPTLLPA